MDDAKTTTETTEIVQGKAPLTIKSILESQRAKVAAACARHMSPDKLMRMALLMASRSPKLAQCTPLSFLGCVMDMGMLGLLPGPLGEAYLVPFERRRKDEDGRWYTAGVDCTLIIGYRGLLKLARRSGQVLSVDADVVRAGDEFIQVRGRNPDLRHVSCAPLSAPITHVWAAATMKDGAFQFTVLRTEEVQAIRARSKAKDDGPWATDWSEMAKKTAIRRLSKLLSLTPETEEILAEVEEQEFDLEVEVPADDRERHKTGDGIAADVRRAAGAARGDPGEGVPPQDTPAASDEEIERRRQALREQAAKARESLPEPSLPAEEDLLAGTTPVAPGETEPPRAARRRK